MIPGYAYYLFPEVYKSLKKSDIDMSLSSKNKYEVKIQERMEQFDGDVGIAVKDVKTGTAFF